MVKPLTVVVVLVVAGIALTSGQESAREIPNQGVSNQDPDREISGQVISAPANNARQDSVTTQDVAPSSNNDSNSGLFSTLLSLPVIGRLLGPILRPLGALLNPIVSVLDFLFKPLNLILSPILKAVSWILGGVDDLVTSLLSGISKLVSLLLSNVSGLLAGLLGGGAITDASSRRRRGVMDSFMGMMLRMTLTLPLRFVRSLFGFFLSPFGFIYDIIMWPFKFIFGGNDVNDLTNRNALSTNFDPFHADMPTYVNNLISSFLLNLSQSSQDAAYEMLLQAWSLTKSTLLPAVDQFIVKAVDSGWVPDDVAKNFQRIHTMYVWLHTLGMI